MNINKLPHLFVNNKCVFCGINADNDPSVKFFLDSSLIRENHRILEMLDEQFRYCSKASRYYYIAADLMLSFFVFLLFDPIIAVIVFFVFLKGLPAFSDWYTGWFFLSEVKDEYGKISEYFAARKKVYFQKQVDEIIQQLKLFRNRAELVLNIVAEESEVEILQKINILELKLKESRDSELTRIYSSQIKDLNDRISKLSDIVSFLDKFLTHKDGVLNSLKLLRTKLLLSETSTDDKEIEGTIEELRSLHIVFEKISANLKF
ncbi:MAG: hypothetical protein HQM10_01535 [Candidatus Riflebacteria bacterium]|nr:hypothetical protein [Candidatus Riflebacteria bacterium]